MKTDFEILNFFKELNSNCSTVIKRTFSKGETITTYIEKRAQLCILMSGTANLIRYDFNGNIDKELNNDEKINITKNKDIVFFINTTPNILNEDLIKFFDDVVNNFEEE